ncbi:hypothetical protein AVEN_181756-1 [Araneus ventricosus]|uniref:Uncharacterized protein n=1 Tax=Araneus ventricosus TaxID=182803 RepID=A0A4Y2P3K2_ARAVE|nr:hypothetical protein AVEN_181756-1 [Araneus ventricosus]
MSFSIHVPVMPRQDRSNSVKFSDITLESVLEQLQRLFHCSVPELQGRTYNSFVLPDITLASVLELFQRMSFTFSVPECQCSNAGRVTLLGSYYYCTLASILGIVIDCHSHSVSPRCQAGWGNSMDSP